ncbi:hypothetical protein ACSTLA_23020, partial [Vibrio parahaemolyticus]
ETVMAPVQVVKTMQVGTRISHVPMGSVPGASASPLKPTPDANSSAPSRTANPKGGLDPNKINTGGASVESVDPFAPHLSDASDTVKHFNVPSV